jgi:dTMP kinase
MSPEGVRGRFVVLDGPDGAGKSTHVAWVAQQLAEAGVRCLSLREPGGTSAGEAVREILLDHRHKNLTPVAETLLFQAARAQLVHEVIRPALDEGSWVLCDRFSLSTQVYQGCAGQVPAEVISGLSALATGGLWPDLYLVLWVPVEIGLQRRLTRTEDRMEAKGLEFMRAVSERYRSLAQASPERYSLLSAEGPLEEVRRRIWQRISPLLPIPGRS